MEHRRFRTYKRICTRCEKIFKATGKFSSICDDCNLMLKRIKEQKEAREKENEMSKTPM